MLQPLRFLFLLCTLALLLGGCIIDPGGTSGRVVVEGDHGMVDIAFNDHDRYLIRDYYGGAKHKGLPPGLAKKGKLPPGIQKQLVRRGQLPPGLQYERFPADLERRLSRIPDGYARIVVDGSFVLFNERTRVIFDIMDDLD